MEKSTAPRKRNGRGLTPLEVGLAGSILFGLVFAGFLSLIPDLPRTFSGAGSSVFFGRAR